MTPEKKAHLDGRRAAKLKKANDIIDAAVPPQEGLIVMELFVENMMKVRLAHLKPKPGLNIIHGDNGSGKTSLLSAIIWGIDGLSTTTTEPIRRGERVGVTRMNLGDQFIVTRYFTRVDPTKSKKGNTYFPKLLVERAKKAPHEGMLENPQRLLNEFIGSISFDPLAFLRMKDGAQLEELRKLVTFDLDIDQLDKDQDEDYEARKLKGREVDAVKARLEGAPAPAEGLPETPIDVAEITKRLEGAANHNSRVEAAKARQIQLRENIAAYQQRAKQIRDKAHELLLEAEELDGYAVELIPAPKRTYEEYGVYRLEQDLRAIEVGELIDTAAVSAELTAATVTNNAIADAARHRTLQKEYDAALAGWETLDTTIKERAKEREAAIGRAKMPIEQLGIGDGEVLYQGLPFSQTSNAEQIRVSMALGMASNPKLRIMVIKDGSLLDEKSVALVDAMAEEKGFQVFMERVMGIGSAGVLMVDGEASGEDVVA